MIGKMIDSLVVAELGRQCHEVLTDPILVNPRDVPLRVGVGLDPSLGLEHVMDGVPKGRAEADLQKAQWYLQRLIVEFNKGREQ